MDAILNGPGGATQLGTGGVTLGRTPENQVVVNDGKASSRHAEIRPSGQGYTITDLGSTNGTFVNGQRLDANTPRTLMPNDTIRIGDTTYTYQAQNYQPGMYAAPVPSAQASNYDPTQIAPQQPFQATSYGGPAQDGGYQPTMPAQPESYQPTMPAYPQYEQQYNQQYNQSYTPTPQQGQGYTPPPPPGPGQSGQSYYDQNNALTQQASYIAGGSGSPSSPYNANQPYAPGVSPGTPSYNPNMPNNAAPGYQQQSGGYGPPPPSPQGFGRRKRNPLLTIILVAIALLLVIGAVSAFFVSSSIQATKDHNTHATATAQSNATQIANTQATTTAGANANATATAQNANPYTNGGTLALNDALKDNTGGHGWEEDSNCQFTQSVYEVTESHSNTFFTCDAKSTTYSNIAYDVALKIIQGDCAGIAFRANVSNDAEYFFEMCQDGTYDVVKYDGSNATYLINVSNSSAIKTGTGQINTLGVVANGSSMELFINGTSVDKTTDSSFSSGSIGVLAVNHTSSSTVVAYAGARVWTL